jgi:hypothetical protein
MAVSTMCLEVHGLPWTMISNCGPQFVAQFTCELYCLLGIKLAASTAYHPQTDCQMECVNQELEQYLRVFASKWQDNWMELLPLAEFQYNNRKGNPHFRCRYHFLTIPAPSAAGSHARRRRRSRLSRSPETSISDPYLSSLVV